MVLDVDCQLSCYCELPLQHHDDHRIPPSDSSLLFKHCFGAHASLNGIITTELLKTYMIGLVKFLDKAMGLITSLITAHWCCIHIGGWLDKSNTSWRCGVVNHPPPHSAWSESPLLIQVDNWSCTFISNVVMYCVCVYMLHSWVSVSVGGRTERERGGWSSYSIQKDRLALLQLWSLSQVMNQSFSSPGRHIFWSTCRP